MLPLPRPGVNSGPKQGSELRPPLPPSPAGRHDGFARNSFGIYRKPLTRAIAPSQHGRTSAMTPAQPARHSFCRSRAAQCEFGPSRQAALVGVEASADLWPLRDRLKARLQPGHEPGFSDGHVPPKNGDDRSSSSSSAPTGKKIDAEVPADHGQHSRDCPSFLVNRERGLPQKKLAARPRTGACCQTREAIPGQFLSPSLSMPRFGRGSHHCADAAAEFWCARAPQINFRLAFHVER